MVPFILRVSTLQCLADCRYTNHFAHHRAGTTLGKAVAAVEQHIRSRCSNSRDHEGISEAGKVCFDGPALHLSLLLGLIQALSYVSLCWRGRVFWLCFVCFKTLDLEKLAGELNFLTLPGKKFNMFQVAT